RRRLFENAEGRDDLDRHLLSADVEILEAPGGLRAVIFIVRNLDLTHGVRFDARAHIASAPVGRFFGGRKTKRPTLMGAGRRNITKSASAPARLSAYFFTERI